MSQDAFEQASAKIGDMVLAILTQTEEAYANAILQELEEASDSSSESVQEEQLSKVTEQLLLVRNALVDDHLKKRYQLKISSKAPTFSELDWDIKLKTDDAKVPELPEFPYATLKLKYQKDFSGSPFALFGGNAFDSVQVNFTIDELDYLISEFTKIRERLQFREEHITG